MTAITADFENVFAQKPAIRARSRGALGYSRPARAEPHGAWARTADDDATRIVRRACSRTRRSPLALLRDLDRAHRSGNPKRVAKVRRRLDRVLDTIEAREH